MGDTNATKAEQLSGDQVVSGRVAALRRLHNGPDSKLLQQFLQVSRRRNSHKQGKNCLNVSEKQSLHHVKKWSLYYGALLW